MKKFNCVCGFIGNANHAKSCKVFNSEVSKVILNFSSYLSQYYLSSYSVTDCCIFVRDKEKTVLSESKLRKMITKYLDENKVRESFSGENFQQFRQKKIQQTMLDRYGVVNAGQMSNRGIGVQNLIPYKKISFADDLVKFREKVRSLSWKFFCKMRKCNMLPTTCYYTGIQFNDIVLDKINPNDPLKRTIDHKVAITEAFFRGWSVEKTASEENMVFCLRIVNTAKGNTTEKDFRKLVLPLLKKRIENEN